MSTKVFIQLKRLWKKITSDQKQADSWAKKQIVGIAKLGGRLVL